MEHEDVQILRQLKATPELFDRLHAAAGTELQIQKQLRAEFPEQLVRAALVLDDLRKRACEKFSKADQMWFDRQGLEQATSEIVANHKAERFDAPVWDLCSGIGGDVIALAKRGDVLAIDQNPAACLRTEWNAEIHGVRDRVAIRCESAEKQWKETREKPSLVHIDPDRRAKGRARSLKIENSQPGPEFLRQLMDEAAGGAIKLSPAANFLGKFPAAEIELVSVNGECKEATIWFGRLAEPGRFRATLLPTNVTLIGHPLEAFCDVGPLGRYLYDPDPAIVRAGLVNLLAERENLIRLDDADEYLTSEEASQSPFVRGFEVLAELPHNDKAIRKYFRGADCGEIAIKCRHVSIDAEALRRKLPRTGTGELVLVFAKIQEKSRAVVCRRL